ncbi:MAG: 6-phosphogluconolactonase [Candidatus Latescibacteria bacterium]|jgi:glucosamine-6-phosphate deaminase|nr:6-phosphogluconolactonase [Candidatus Latescibacterota bacterium]
MNYGKTAVVVCKDDRELGERAASDVAHKMRGLLSERDVIRVVFSAAESQVTFLDALAKEQGIDWGQVVCLNVDDLHDVRMPEACTCGYLTRTHLYDKIGPLRVHLIRHDAPDPEAEAKRFEAVLREEGPIDIICQGIGTSGHLALNEPGITNFDDERWVRVVGIAEQSKQQLLEDPHFMQLGYIPEIGITMTIPALRSARHRFTMVPYENKRSIIKKLFEQKTPTAELPASILLELDGTLYLERASCP